MLDAWSTLCWFCNGVHGIGDVVLSDVVHIRIIHIPINTFPLSWNCFVAKNFFSTIVLHFTGTKNDRINLVLTLPYCQGVICKRYLLIKRIHSPFYNALWNSNHKVVQGNLFQNVLSYQNYLTSQAIYFLSVFWYNGLDLVWKRKGETRAKVPQTNRWLSARLQYLHW